MKFIRPIAVTDTVLVSSTVPETLPEYDPAVTYVAGDRVRSAARVYESQQATNTGNALTELAWWVEVGPTNRWAMFDDVNSTATTGTTEISFTVRPGSIVNSLALMDVSAVNVSVVATSDSEGEVFNQTYSMVDDGGINDYYSWFFEAIDRKSVLIVSGIPPMNDLQVAVTISGEDLSLATFAIGAIREIGASVYGASVGIRDFSRKETDDFGSLVLVERSYSKSGNFTVWCAAGMVDAIARSLAKYRATPLVWIGSDAYTSTVIFGFYKDWSLEIAYPTKSICTLEIEGLT